MDVGITHGYVEKGEVNPPTFRVSESKIHTNHAIVESIVVRVLVNSEEIGSILRNMFGLEDDS